MSSRGRVRSITLAMSILVWAGPTVRAQEEGKEGGLFRPFRFGLEYTAVSDYLFRGSNLSEPAGEKVDKLNHQVAFGVTTDLLDLAGWDVGTIGGSIWWEWYGGQKMLNREAGLPDGTDAHLQEVDYSLTYEVELAGILPFSGPLGATLALELVSYTLPNVRGSAHDTYEYKVGLSFDDAGWYGDNPSLFNPSVTYWHDFDNIDGGWLEAGICHEFRLGDYLGDLPVIGDITLTPSFTAAWDLHYNDTDAATLGVLLYQVDLTLPLGGLLPVPERYGSFSLGLFAGFMDARNEKLQNDEPYGGVTLAVSW